MTESESPTQHGPVAGWYADPELAGTQRYWDGRAWTEHRHPPTRAPLPLKQANDMALGGFIAGCVAVFFGLIPFTWFISIPAGIGALVCSVIGSRAAKENPNLKHRDLGTWGIGLGAVGVVFGIIGVILTITLFDDVEEAIDDHGPAIERSIDELERELDDDFPPPPDGQPPPRPSQ